MIIRVNGSYSFKLEENGVHWCGKDDTGSIAAGLGIRTSKTLFKYTEQPGGVIPIAEVIKLNKFTTEWLKKYKNMKGKYYEQYKD